MSDKINTIQFHPAFKKYSSDESDALELMEEEDEAEEARAANARRSQHHQRAFSRQFDPCRLRQH